MGEGLTGGVGGVTAYLRGRRVHFRYQWTRSKFVQRSPLERLSYITSIQQNNNNNNDYIRLRGSIHVCEVRVRCVCAVCGVCVLFMNNNDILLITAPHTREEL